MNKRNLILLIWILLLIACASEPYSSAKEINEACSFELQAALTAVKLRNKNTPKSSLLTKLSPLDKNSSRLLVNMYQIVDETYSNPWLNKTIYPTYRFELCQRQLLFKPYPLTIDPVLPVLKECQKLYGIKSSEQSTNCILDGLNKY